MTVSETAERVGISKSKVYQLVRARRLGHYRVGAKIIIEEADVAAYLARCRVSPVGPASSTSRPQPKLLHLNLSRA